MQDTTGGGEDGHRSGSSGAGAGDGTELLIAVPCFCFKLLDSGSYGPAQRASAAFLGGGPENAPVSLVLFDERRAPICRAAAVTVLEADAAAAEAAAAAGSAPPPRYLHVGDADAPGVMWALQVDGHGGGFAALREWAPRLGMGGAAAVEAARAAGAAAEAAEAKAKAAEEAEAVEAARHAERKKERRHRQRERRSSGGGGGSSSGSSRNRSSGGGEAAGSGKGSGSRSSRSKQRGSGDGSRASPSGKRRGAGGGSGDGAAAPHVIEEEDPAAAAAAPAPAPAASSGGGGGGLTPELLAVFDEQEEALAAALGEAEELRGEAASLRAEEEEREEEVDRHMAEVASLRVRLAREQERSEALARESDLGYAIAKLAAELESLPDALGAMLGTASRKTLGVVYQGVEARLAEEEAAGAACDKGRALSVVRTVVQLA